jgi:hypothetical protein
VADQPMVLSLPGREHVRLGDHVPSEGFSQDVGVEAGRYSWSIRR